MYIDPNTGGTLFQALATFLALFSGFALLFSSRIQAAIARFRRSRRGGDELEDQSAETGEAEPSIGGIEDSDTSI